MSNKIQQYALTASVHTLTVKSVEQPNIPFLVDKEAVLSSFYSKKENWFTKINLNKIYGDILSYAEFNNRLNDLLHRMGIEDYSCWRVDIRLDSYEDNFKEYYKLNSWLINSFNLLFNGTDSQAVEFSLSQSKELSNIRGKNQYFEVTYYDKKLQTNDTDPAKARLEFRSLKSTNILGHTPEEIKSIWFKKLDAIVLMYDKLQEECNKNLLEAYRRYCNYSKEPEKECLTKFFSEYTNGLTVYTRKQLSNFFLLCGVPQSTVKDRVDYICTKYKIEFFTKEDLMEYIKKIKEAMNNFFEN